MQDAARLAGFFAAHAVWSVSDGSTLIPLRGSEGADGSRRMTRFGDEDLAVATGAGKEAQALNPDAAARAVLVTDAYLNLPEGRTDALIVETAEYGAEPRSVLMAIPYRPQESPSGFAVLRPVVLELKGVEEAGLDALFEAFFAGVASHEEAAEVWNAHLDES